MSYVNTSIKHASVVNIHTCIKDETCVFSRICSKRTLKKALRKVSQYACQLLLKGDVTSVMLYMVLGCDHSDCAACFCAGLG